MEGAQLMRHGVAHTQEGVGEGHTGHGGGVGHLLAGLGIVGAVVIGAGQVLKDDLQGLERQTVGVIGSHHAGIGFQRVGNGVDTARRRSDRVGAVIMQVRVDDGHLGQQLVVGQGILDARASRR